MRAATPIRSLILLDVRGIRRDHVALATVGLSVMGTLAITLLGFFQHRLPGWSAWFPFMVAVSLLGGPGGFGFLFGLMMVEEGDTGARDALSVTPVPPTLVLLTRTVVVAGWMAVWPLASVYLMNWGWRAIDFPLAYWLAVIGPLAIVSPALALLIPAVAEDKVGALAVFKGLSFIMLLPLALFIISPEAWYRVLFLLSPTGWVMEAFLAYLDGAGARGYQWSMAGAAYGLLLLASAVGVFRRKIYRLDH